MNTSKSSQVFLAISHSQHLKIFGPIKLFPFAGDMRKGGIAAIWIMIKN